MDRRLIIATPGRFFVVLMFLATALSGCANADSALTPIDRQYESTWESLAKHTDPEWFRDAKFGIYTHWGPVTFGAEDGPGGVQWYGRNMYVPDSPTFKYHRKRFGDQNKVGYKDIIPLFNPKKFDAETWAELFAAAGAKFAGPVVIHHDNYAMWDSAFTEWDSMDQSPKRDFTAELEKAIRKRNMKFIATFHHAFAWRYYEPALKFDAADGRYAGLYCQPRKLGSPPTKKYMDKWLGMVNEVVEKYQPDLTWFDFGLSSVITPEYQQRMFADYYNWAQKNGRDVGVAHKHRNIRQHTGILDFERGREDRLTPYPWLTDTSVGPWFHQKSSSFKTVNELVDVLVDIVSKNGCMLLNVGPQANGAIPEKGKKILRGMGAWLKINGQGIYNTRPWQTFGEGPTSNSGGGFSENNDKPYTSQDIRFTQSKDGKTIYVIFLGWPEKEVTIRSMKVDAANTNARIELLGGGKVTYKVNTQKQLVIQPPVQRSGEHAFVFKMTGFDISLQDSVRFEQPEAVRLGPDKATLEGKKIQTQTNEDRLNIGYWDNPNERIHWLVNIPESGSYVVRGEFSSAYGTSGLKVSAAGQTRSAEVPKTNGWFKPQFVSFGTFNFAKAGVYHLVLQPSDPARWRAVNVYQLQLAPK